MHKEKYYQYALYKGDKFITTGSVPEISKELGITKAAVRWYGTPYARRTNKGNAKILIKLEGSSYE